MLLPCHHMFVRMSLFYLCTSFFPPATINSPVTSLFLFMELSLLFWFAAKTNDFFWRGDTVAATFGEKRGMGLRGLQASLLQDVSNPLRFERKMTSKPGRMNNRNRPGRRRLKKTIQPWRHSTSYFNCFAATLNWKNKTGSGLSKTEQRIEVSLKASRLLSNAEKEWNIPDLTVTSFGGLREWGPYHSRSSAQKQTRSKPIIHMHPPLYSFRQTEDLTAPMMQNPAVVTNVWPRYQRNLLKHFL